MMNDINPFKSSNNFVYMGLIDSKGRLFGKLNIIDFIIIILVLICIIAAVRFFAASTSTDLASASTKILGETKENYVPVQLRIYNKHSNIINQISVGDKEYDLQKKMIMQVLSKKVINNFEGYDNVEFSANISVVDVGEGKIFFKDREVKLGEIMNINTEKYTFWADIVGFGVEKLNYSVNEVEVYCINASQSLIDAFEIGDKDIFYNKTTLKIISKEIQVNEDSSNYLNLTAKILLGIDAEGKTYYQGNGIKINSLIQVNTNRISLYGTITSADDKDDVLIPTKIELKTT